MPTEIYGSFCNARYIPVNNHTAVLTEADIRLIIAFIMQEVREKDRNQTCIVSQILFLDMTRDLAVL